MKALTEYFNSGSIKQQNKKRLGALLICATAILLCIALIVLTAASIVTALKNRTVEDEEDSEESGGIPGGYTTTTPEASQLSTGTLLLLDETHPYTGEVPAVVAISNRPQTAEGTNAYSAYTDSCYLTQEALDALNKMVTDFYAAKQDDCLYLIKTEYGTILTLTYYSELNKINTNSIYDSENDQPVDTYKWIYDNAASYGFVAASSTEGAENVFRYVGVPHALAMDALNADTFPAYLETLKTRCSKPSSARSVNTETARYKVYYQAAVADTPILVPETNPYTISGNNVDGYIITETISTQKK